MAKTRVRRAFVPAVIVLLLSAPAIAGPWQRIPHRAGDKLKWAPVPGAARYFVEDLETGWRCRCRVVRHSFSPRTGESRIEFVAPCTALGATRVIVKNRVGEGGGSVR